ncbi:class Ib ribonucleoside-diphosphate reductase assembly flavoprotein NrdI, partial [Lactobacillus salivarius]|nr:class Ib ribonucleoside-diphosphate reductase assembly flavoprotein NrdI [Ligilactobacillus salivarius]
MKIVYFTVTGQTKRFIKKLGSNYEYFEIDAAN